MMATVGGDLVRSERSTSFLCYAKLGEFVVKCSDAVTVEVDILCHTLAFFALRRLIVIFQRKVLKTLYNILFTVAEFVSRTIFVPFLRD